MRSRSTAPIRSATTPARAALPEIFCSRPVPTPRAAASARPRGITTCPCATAQSRSATTSSSSAASSPTRRCRWHSFRVDAMTRPAISAEGVGKRFGATVALDGVDFDVALGEIHAVVGERRAALEKREIERLFSVLARMKRQCTAVIYISHRLDEVVAIADRCTVLRDGRVAAVAARGTFAVNDLVGAMIGRLAQGAVAFSLPAGEPLLEAQPEGVATVCVREREVVGLAGLLGSGADRVIHSLFLARNDPTKVARRADKRRVGNPAHA